MEMSPLFSHLAEIRKQLTRPATQMYLIRQALQSQVASLASMPTPQVFTNEQRKTLLEDVNTLEEFLKNEDGRDAMEILMTAFSEFKERKANPELYSDEKANEEIKYQEPPTVSTTEN
jgi:hypothetical protein